jgi:hypothetical protein
MTRTIITVALLALAITASAQAREPSVSAANTALERKVEQRYPRLTLGRLVVVSCRRRHHEFFCLYGIHANQADAIEEPDERWVYSGVGYVRVRKGRLVAEALSASPGGDYAPY